MRNFKKKFTIVLSSLTMVLTLAGCGDAKAEKWNINESEKQNLCWLNPYVEVEETKSTIFVDMTNAIFNKKFEKDDLIFFDCSEAVGTASKVSENVLSYSYMKNHQLQYDSYVIGDNLSSLTLTCSYEVPEDFMILVHKDVCASGAFTTICHDDADEVKFTDLTPEQQAQEDYEKKYAQTKIDWENAQTGKFLIDIVTNLGAIAASLALDSPITAVTSLFNLLNTISSQFIAAGPTMADIMDKLKEMDAKLDRILSMLESNQRQLETEAVRTQAAVDKVLLEQQEQAIVAFKTDYLDKITDFNSLYSVHVTEEFKKFVSNNYASTDVYLYKNKRGEWCSRLLPEFGLYPSDTKITFTMGDFTNSRAELQKNNNVIKAGFMDALYKDINNAISTKLLPEGLPQSNFVYFVASNLAEGINKAYFNQNKTKAQEFANLMIHTCERYSGVGAKSIVQTYYDRFKYTYNFAGEMKKPMTTFISRHLYNLDTAVARATTYLAYAELDDSNLAKIYKATRTYMNEFYQTTQKMDDTYSNILGYSLDSSLFNLHYEQRWTSKGNHPGWTGTLIQRYYEFVNGKLNIYDTNINNFASIQEIDHTRIKFRLSLLRELGQTKSETYIDYLRTTNIVQQKVWDASRQIIRNNWCPSITKIATAFTERDMDDRDKSISLKCTEKSHGDSHYFSEGNWYNFRGSRNSGDWHGRILESTMLDYNTGNVLSDKMVCARARYSEGHWYWRVDEDWLFTTYDGVYVFQIYAKKA